MYASICVDYLSFPTTTIPHSLLWSHRLKELCHLWFWNRTNELSDRLPAVESDDRRKRPDLDRLR